MSRQMPSQIRRRALPLGAAVLVVLAGILAQAGTVFLDDFNRSITNQTIIGNNWIEVSTGLGDAAITNNMLVLKNGATAGRTWIAQSFANFSSPWTNRLASNQDLVTWAFNMRSVRGGFNALTGFDSGQYGIACVLANSSQDFLSGVGYAVVWGQVGGVTPLRLVKFSNGLTNNAALANLIVATTGVFTNVGTSYLSVRVTYDPYTDTWTLFGRNDGTSAFADPASGTLTSLGQAVDGTYTHQALGHLGAFWNYNTTLNQWTWWDSFSVSVNQTAPSIVTQPQTQYPVQGSSVTLSATVEGTRPLAYQWFDNGSLMTGYTNSSFTIANFQAGNEGNYRVVITNNYGSVTSAVATLTIARSYGAAPDPPYPTYLAQNGARHLIVPGYYLGQTVTPQGDATPSVNAGGPGADGVFLTSPLTAGQPATLQVVASTNGLLNAWMDFNQNGGWADAGEQVLVNQALVPGVNNLSFAVPASAVTGADAYARFRFSTASGLSYTGDAANGEVEDYRFGVNTAADLAVGITVAPNPVAAGSNVTYTVTINNQGPSQATGVQLTNVLPASVSFVSASTTQGSFTQTGPTTICNLGMLLSGATATVTVVGVPGLAGTVTDTAQAGGNEADPDPANNSASAGVTVNDRVLITSGPTDLTVTNGATATFTVTASGTGTLRYQWRFNGANLANATNATLNIVNAQPANTGPYDVIVLDDISYAISTSATLTVLVKPTITAQPQNQTGPLGGSATFNVSATGTVPLSYQWYFNATNELAGGTASTLTLNNLTTNNAGNYQVVVANVAGAATSSVAVLTIAPMNFGTAPDPPFPTYLASNGARHLIVATAHMGACETSRSDGQPTADASGDPCRDGVTFTNTMVAGQGQSVKVIVSTAGYLSAWMDFSQDGAWSQGSDQIFRDEPVLAGVTNWLTFQVPAYAQVGTVISRWRFSTTPGLSYTGLAADGEVEDYAFPVDPATATQLVLATDVPAYGTAGVPFDPPPRVWVADSLGQPVFSDNSTVVTATRLSGAGTLLGTTSVTAVNGVASFDNLYATLATNITIRFTAGAFNALTSSVVQVEAGPASQLGILTQPAASATAGVIFTTQPAVQALDAYGNPTTNGVSGTVVTARRNLGSGTLQGNTTANINASGTATFSGLYHTVANTINLGFDAANLASAFAANTVVNPNTANNLAFLTQPGNATVGALLSQQPVVRSQDQYGNASTVGLAASKTVTVSLNNSGVLLGTTNLDIGTGSGNGTVSYANLQVNSAGLGQRLVASASSMTSGTSALFDVAAGPFTKMQVLLPGETAAPGTATGKTGTPTAQTVGVSFNVTVNGVDSLWNVISNVTDLVSVVTANGSFATNVALANGSVTCPVTFTTPGTLTFVASDVSDITKTSNTSPAVTVNAGGFAKLQLLVPGETAAPGTSTGKTGTPIAPTAGTAFNVTVNAVDSYWNLTASVTDTVGITSSDTYAALPATAPLVAGTRSFTVTLKAAGSQTLTASDITNGSKPASTSPPIPVNTGPFAKLQLLVPGETAAPGSTIGKSGTPNAQTAGTALSVTVNAVDANWNLIASATDTVGITASDPNAVLPANASLVGGTRSFSVTLKTAGSRTVTATDVSDGSKTANTSAAIPVGAGLFVKLQLLVPGETAAPGGASGKSGTPSVWTADVAANVTVNAVDANWNVVSNVTDTIALTSSDANATLPANAALVAGTKSVSVILTTPATNATTITATDVSDGTKTASTSPPLTVTTPQYTSATGGLAISADTTGGSYTGLTGPVYSEVASGNVGTGTIVLNAPSGFVFDTGSPVAAVRIDRIGGSSDSKNINGATSGSTNAMTSISSSQLTFTITKASSQGNYGRLTWVNVRVRPSAGTPLASGNISRSGTATMAGVPTTANFGTLREIVGGAKRLGIQTQPSATATAGVALAQQPVLRIEDQFGNLRSASNGGADNTSVVTAARAAGAGTLQGTLNATAANGLATFVNLSHNVATNITIAFTSGTLTSATSSTVSVNAAAATLIAFVQQPTDVAAGAAVTPAVTVRAQDPFANVVPGVNVAMTLSSGTGSLAGTTTRTTGANGLATFNDLTLNLAGTKTLRATSGALSPADSSSFAILPAPAVGLVFVQPPGGTVAGAPFGVQPVARTRDAFGNDSTVGLPGNLPVTSALSAGSGVLLGTTTLDIGTNAGNGVAAFANLEIDVAGAGKQLTVTAAGLSSGLSGPFAVSPAAAAQLVFVQPPTDTTAGQAISPAVTVQAYDPFGNGVSGVAVSLSLASGSGALQGTISGATDANGLVQFNELTLILAGVKTLRATSGALSPADSSSFAILPAPAAQYLLSVSGAHPVAGSPITLAAQLVDAYSNLVASAGLTVTWTKTGAGGSFSSPTSVTAPDGAATVSFTTAINAGVTYTFTATDSNQASGTSADVTTVPGSATQYLVSTTSTQPIAGSAVAITAQLADANHNPVSTPGMVVTWSKDDAGGAFSSAASITTTDGIATVTFTSGTVAGTACAITATDAQNLTGASPTITTVAGPAAMYLVTAGTGTAVAGSSVTISAQLADAHSNLVASAGRNVTWANTGGGGSFEAATSVTDASGLASATFNTSTNAGTVHTVTAMDDQSVTGTSGGITTVPGAAVKYLVGSSTTNPVAGSTLTLTAQLADSNNNAVATEGMLVTWTNTGAGGELSSPTSVTDTNGAAPVSFVTATNAGVVYTFTAADADNRAGTSAAITTVSGAATQYFVTTTSTSPVAGSTVTVTAQLLDANANPVRTAGAVVTWSKNAPGGAFSSATSVTTGDGVATVMFTSSTVAGAVCAITATDAQDVTGTSPMITTVAGPAAAYRVAASSGTPVAGSPVTITAQLVDANSNAVAAAGRVVAWSKTGAGGVFGDATSVTDANGLVTVVFTTAPTAGTIYAVIATDDQGQAGSSASITTVAGLATKYLVSLSTRTPFAGSDVVVTAQLADANDNPVSTAGRVATWTSTGGGSFSSGTSVTTPDGTATVSFTCDTLAGTVHTVTATDDQSLTGTSATMTSTVGPAAKYLVSASDYSPLAGDSVTITAQLADASGNVVASAGRTVTWTHTGTGSSFASPTGTTDGSGVATVQFTTTGAAGTPQTVTATDDQAISGTSPSITTIAGTDFVKLQILLPGEVAAPGTPTGKTGAPSAQSAEHPFTVTVQAVDSRWNVVPAVTDVVSLTSTEATAILPAETALLDGTAALTVTLLSVAATNTITAHDLSDGAKLPSTSLSITVLAPPYSVASGGDAISADTVGGAFTTLTGPVYSEAFSGAVGLGTLVLNAPAGFEFDPGGLAPSVRVTRLGGSGDAAANLNGVSSGTPVPATSVTASQVTFTVTGASSGGVTCSLTWQDVRVRPTAGTPLATGTITVSGTASVANVSSNSIFGTLREIAGAPGRLPIQTQPSATGVAGVPFAVQPVVRVEDQFGNLRNAVNGASDNATTVTATRDAGAGTLQGTTSAAANDGVVVFTDLKHLVATNITLIFTSGAVSSESSSVIAINPAPASMLAFATNPAGAVAGAPFGTQPVVHTQDPFGNDSTIGLADTLALNLTLLGGGGPLQGSTSADIGALGGNGVASFTDLQIDTAATGYRLSAVVTGFDGVTSAPFTVNPATPTRITFVQPPTDVVAGQPITPAVVLLVQDSLGNAVAGQTVSLSLAGGTGPLNGTIAALTDATGQAVFSDLTLNVSGAKVLRVVSGSLAPLDSAAFTVAPAAATQLVIQTQPSSSAVAGVPLATQPVVVVADQFGNVRTADNSTVVLAARNAGSGVLQGNTSATAFNGVASFTDLFHTVATTISIQFTGGALTPANSTPIAVSAAEAHHLELVEGDGQTAPAGTSVPVQPRVRVVDAFDNPVAGVTVSFAVQTGGGSVSAAEVDSDAAGFAGAAYTLGTTYGINNNTMLASATVAGSPSSVLFTASAAFGTESRLVIHTPPAAQAVAGQLFDPQPEVRLEDQFGNLRTNDSTTVVTAARADGSGELQGTTNLTAIAGVTVFTDLAHVVATNITIRFHASGWSEVVSDTITISPAAAAQLVFAIQPGTAVVGSSLSVQPVVKSQDAFGNDSTVGIADSLFVTSTLVGHAELLQGTAVVDLGTQAGNGVATFTNLRVDRAGTYQLAANADGLGGVLSSGFVVHAGAASQLVFEQQPGNVTAGQPIAPAVSVRVTDDFADGIGGVAVTLGLRGGTGNLSGTLTQTSDANGLAVFAGLSIDLAGAQVLRATSGSLPVAESSSFIVSPAAATRLVLVQQVSNAVAGAVFGQQPVLKSRDVFGNDSTLGLPPSLLVTNVLVGHASLLLGTTALDIGTDLGNGTVAFTDLEVDVAGADYQLSFGAPGLGEVSSDTFEVSPATATQLVFVRQPGSAAAGAPFGVQPEIHSRDAYGNDSTVGLPGSLTANLTLSPAAELRGTTSFDIGTNAANGVIVCADLEIDVVGSSYQLTASAPGLPSGTSALFAVDYSAGRRLVFVQQPTDTVAGQTINPAVTLQLQDDAGNSVAMSGVPVVLTLNGSGALGGAASQVTDTGGSATFGDLRVDRVGSKTLTAAADGLGSVESSAFVITPAAATQLVFVQEAGSAVAGTVFGLQPAVRTRDAFGNDSSVGLGASVLVTTALAGHEGRLQGTAVLDIGTGAGGGLVSWTDLRVDVAGADYQLVANAEGLGGATGAVFSVSAAAAAVVVWVQEPTVAVAGVAIAPAVRVQLKDAYGNAVPDTGVSLSVALSSGSGVLSGATSQATDADGQAGFEDLRIDLAGSKTLTVSGEGLTPAVSGAFAILPAGATHLGFGQQPGETAAGVAIGPAVRVRLLDGFGNAVPSAGVNVSVSLGGAGVLSGTTTQATDAEGVAVFGDLRVDRVGSKTLTAAADGLGSVESSAFVITPAAATRLAFVAPPGDTLAGQVVSPAVAVQVQDAFGNNVPGSGVSITLSLGSGSGVLGGTISQQTVGTGLATFGDLSVNLSGNKTLVVASAGLASAESSPFTISPAAAVKLTMATPPSSVAVAGVPFAQQPVIRIEDQFGNLCASDNTSRVVVALHSGSGLLQGTTDLAAINGVVGFANLSYPIAEAITLAFGSGSLSGTVSGLITVQPASASQLVFAVQPGSAAVGAVFGSQPVVVTKDAFGNLSTVGLPASLPVILTVASGTGPLLGTTLLDIGASAGNGQVAATDLRIDVAGANYRLAANGTGLAPALSSVFTVAKGSQTITFPAIPNKTYGDPPFALEATASSGLTVTLGLLPGPASLAGNTLTILGAGTITVRASQAGDDNWNAAASVFRTFTVSRAILTVTADNKSKVYCATNPPLTFRYTGFVNGENTNALSGAPVIGTTATTASPVTSGGYPITVTAGTLAAANYLFSFVNGTLTVTGAPLVVTGDDASRVYGVTNPPFSGSLTGVTNNDGITASFTSAATTNSPVGSYAIGPVFNDPKGALGNYSITTNLGTLTVSQAALQVLISSATRAYGDDNPPLSGLVLGRKNNDEITATFDTPAHRSSPIGSYPIFPVFSDPDNRLANYSVSTNVAMLTITSAPLWATAGDAARVYGQANPMLGGTLIGVKAGDNIIASYATTAQASSPVGAYPITVSLVDPDSRLGNYSVTTQEGTLSVTPAALTVGADDASKVYGQADPTLTYRITAGALVGGDSLSGALSRAAGEDVGVYPIGQGTLAAGANYTLSFVGANLTITPAVLTVRADDQSRAYGLANPTLTASYSGFVNQETPDVLSGMAELSTTAEATSPVGSYPISVSAGSLSAANYTFSLEPGTLTVTKAASRVALAGSPNPALPDAPVTFVATVSPAPPAIGMPTGTVQFRADDALLGGSVALNGMGVATLTTATLGHGTHQVTAEYTGDANFNPSLSQPGLQQVVNTAPSGDGLATQRYDYGGVHVGIDAVLGSFGDPDGDTITLVSAGPTSQQGGEVTLHDRWISYIPPPDYAGADSFDCTVQDLFGLEATATVSISIRTNSDPSQNITRVEQLGDGSWRIGFLGIPGLTYSIEYAAPIEPLQWESLGTCTADATGSFGFTDSEHTGAESRLYRSTYQLAAGVDPSNPNLSNFGSAGGQTQTEGTNLSENTQTKDPMKNATMVAILGLFGAVSPPLLGADQPNETHNFTAINRVVPDGRADGLLDSRTINSAIGSISSVKVHLKINGEFNGDLYAYLRHVQNGQTHFAVLLNRTGKTATDNHGYDDEGLDVNFLQGAANGNIHLYRNAVQPASPLAGDWLPDGRDVDPALVTDASAVTTSLANFAGVPAAGEWQLFVADLESGGANTLVEWGLEITGGVYPTIAWANPEDIVYGTALGAAQLNATATYNANPVEGTFAYTPAAATFLGAGTAQTLSVTFTPTDTSTYLPVTKTVTINVARKPLTIAADAKSKTYGDDNPTLTATVTGTIGSDTVLYTLASTAQQFSGVGDYPITVTPGDNPNYSVTAPGSTLTINAKAATIVAEAKDKTYGDANPALTAAVEGTVNGDTLDYSLATTAQQLSGVGSYPITIALGTNPNYTVTPTDSTLTVLARAATVVAGNKAKTYGDDNPMLSAAVTGQPDGGAAINYTLSTTALKFSGAGSYPITVSLGSNPNYTVTRTDANLTISPLAVNIVADDKSRVFGQDNPALTAVVTGTVNNDTLDYTLATTAEKLSNVGQYPISVVLGSNPNYVVNKTEGTLSIDKASTAAMLTSAPIPAAAGANVTFTMTVNANAPSAAIPDGTVDFTIDGSAAGSGALSGGVATLATAALSHGTHTVAAAYAGNGNFIGSTAALTPDQVINGVPVAAADTIERYPTQGVKVKLATLLANDTDGDSDTLTATVSATSANGGTVTVRGAWVFYAPADGNTDADSFTYTVSDGHGGTATGTVTVAVKQVDEAPIETGQNMTVVANQNGTVEVRGSGIPGRTYTLEYANTADPMPSWQTLTSGNPSVQVDVVADATGVFSYTDSPPVGQTRVYRSVHPPLTP